MVSDPVLLLTRFWQTAALPVPIVIVGGGRWAKVWASVIAQAHGHSQHLMMVARTDPAAVRAWAHDTPEFHHLVVCESLNEAVSQRGDLQLAIVCSRPRDHLRDALEAFRCGLHVLVEKPIATSAADALSMLVAAQRARRKLEIGTEFAYLPALHQCARAWDAQMRDGPEIRLDWEDPLVEARYGATKSRHPEVDAPGDLLPHAFSIFRTLAPSSNFRLVDVQLTDQGLSGSMRFLDQRSGVFTLVFDLASQRRKRLVETEVGTDRIAIDFRDKLSSITVNQQPYPLDPQLVPLDSTLRLQWGAFVAAWSDRETQTEVNPSVEALTKLQLELETFSR